MSVALMWVVSPNSEVSKGNRLTDSSRFIARGRNLFRSGRINNVKKKQKWNSCYHNADLRYSCLGDSGLESGKRFSVVSSMVANPAGEMTISSEQLVYDVVLKQAALVKQLRSSRDMEVKPEIILPGTLSVLSEAYDRCGEVCAEYAKTFYLGTLLMTPERRKAIWAIYGVRTERFAFVFPQRLYD